jgi:hypothetical protein
VAEGRWWPKEGCWRMLAETMTKGSGRLKALAREGTIVGDHYGQRLSCSKDLTSFKVYFLALNPMERLKDSMKSSVESWNIR